MKRIITALLFAVLLASAASCAGTDAVTTAEITVEQTEKETAAQSESTRTEETERPETKEATTAEPETEGYMTYQLLRDLKFERGIKIYSQKNHENGETFRVLKTHDFYGKRAESPLWGLAQWDSGPDLVKSLIKTTPDTLTDGKWRTFAYNAEENVITFKLDTSAYYEGRPAVEGDYWPHLLAEQSDFALSEIEKSRRFYRCDADKIIVSLDIRLGDYNETPVEGDFVRAAQFMMYVYAKGLDNGDFCWFGLQFFDNRGEACESHIGYDGGKADASGAMIYLIGSKYVYENSEGNLWENGAPKPNGEWVHVEIDIKPYLEHMFEIGKAAGYFKSNSLGRLRLDGMNIGWETIGTFDHTMQVRDLQVVSYIKS